MNPDTANTLIKGIIGTAVPAAGIAVSTVSKIELGLRIISLTVGIAVGLVTLYKLGKKKD